MPRLTRTAAWIGVSAALVVLSPLDAAAFAFAAPHPPAAKAPPGSAWTVNRADGEMPGMDHGDMPGMDHGSEPAGASPAPAGSDHGGMPGMDHTSSSTGEHGSAPAGEHGSEHGAEGGAAAGHGEQAIPVSRPRGLVLGAFALVNGGVMAAAAVLRRRTVGRQGRRGPRRPVPVV